ncbi:MAG TPA: response regulator [Candidatus Sulfotelmatobacter sp.]|nr:response regulator [Candidatus Sulfotelmatobacter sp.]
MANVLLIEDEAGIREIIRAILEKGGHRVVEAGDGIDGMNRFQVESFDLVITDIIMPDREGIETIRLLRAAQPDLPIIAVSGGGRVEAGDYLYLAASFGATATLAKPFSPAELRRVVQQVLEPSSLN